MAPSSYKVVGLLSLLHSMSTVVAKPVDLQRASSLTIPTVILKTGPVANLIATPSPSQAVNTINSGSVNHTPVKGPPGDGKSLTSVQKPKPTKSNATGDRNGHHPLASGVWSWRHPKRPGSSPISSAGAPSPSDQIIDDPGSGNYLIARGGPPSPGKTMLDPMVVVEHNRKAQATRHAHNQRKREISTEKPPNPSSSASAATSRPASAASVSPVTQSSTALVTAGSTPSGTSPSKSSISSIPAASSSSSSSSASASASASAKKRGILYNSASSANAFIVLLRFWCRIFPITLGA